MTSKAVLFGLLILFFSCTAEKKDEIPKHQGKQKQEISFENIEGFWVNSVFVDSVVSNRSFSKYASALLLHPRTIDVRDGLMIFVMQQDTIVLDSLRSDLFNIQSDSVLKICFYCEDGRDSLVFKKRNQYREFFLDSDNCPNNLGLYKGCGYVRLFSKLVLEGSYDVVLKKGDFSHSSNEVRIEDGLILRIGQNAPELYLDDYSGTIHFNGGNDALFLIRDSTYHKSYHWRFSGDTLILHEWNVIRKFEDEISPEHTVGKPVLKMIKRK